MELLLADVWTGSPVKGWFVSEKFDGVRALWDGSRLWSRNGNEFHPPAWWAAKLPADVALDGELWAGRGGFLRVLAEVKRHAPDDAAWRQISFCVFDLPQHGGPFEDRQAALAALGLVSPVAVVQQTRCEDRWHLRRILREVWDAGGEGVMLRQPGSRYEPGRSASLLKVRCENNFSLVQRQRAA